MPTYTRRIEASLLTTGLTAGSALGYTVVGVGGATLVARTTAGVTEDGSSASYYADVAGWDVAWSGSIVWDAGAGTLAREAFTAYAPQAGDAAALIGAGGANLTALGDARLAHLNADISSIVPLTAAGIRAAVGLATANLDAQLGGLPAVKAVTDRLNTALVLAGSVYQFTVTALANAPAGGGGAGGGLDAYQAAYLTGPLVVQADGSWIYYDAADGTTPRLKFARHPGRGGRDVTKDPVP